MDKRVDAVELVDALYDVVLIVDVRVNLINLVPTLLSLVNYTSPLEGYTIHLHTLAAMFGEEIARIRKLGVQGVSCRSHVPRI
jgi:hypothetical protein